MIPGILPLALPLLIDKLGNTGINLLPAYLVRNGMSAEDSTLIMGIVKSANVVGPFFIGLFIEKLGAKAITTASFLLCAIGFCLIPSFSAWQAIAILGFLAALGSSGSKSAIRSLMVETIPENQLKEGFGWLRMNSNAGVAIAFLFSGYLASLNFSSVFWLDGFTSLIALFVFVLFYKPRKKENQTLNNENKISEEKIAQSSSQRKVNLWHKIFTFNSDIGAVYLFTFIYFLNFFSYGLFDASLPARYELLFPGKGASMSAFANIINTVFCAVTAIHAAKYLKPKLSWLVWGNILIGLGAYIANVSPSAMTLAAGMLVYTLGEIFFASCGSYFLIQLTQKTQAPAFWFGTSQSLISLSQPALGFAAFPLIVSAKGLSSDIWFLVFGGAATLSVFLLKFSKNFRAIEET
jgi:hypothetical protein